MRVAIAPRVSSDMQAETGWSFDDQVKRGRAWAKSNGHTVSRIYFQAGVSAGKADRDELLAIVAGAAADEWDALWIRELSRFTRNPDDLKHLRAIELYGKLIFEDGQPITSITPEGQLNVGIRTHLNAYQLANIRKTTSYGKKSRAESGKVNVSIPPTGYDLKDGTLVPRNDNAPAIAMIFAKFSTGLYSIRQVTEMVQAAGYKTNAGKPFSIDTVTAVLRNKTYAGFVPYRGLQPIYTEVKRGRNSKKSIEWTRGTHPALVDLSTWEVCAAIRAKRAGRTGRVVKPHRVYLINKLATCSKCGLPMRARASQYEKPQYRCTSHERGLPCPSKATQIVEWKLEPQIDEAMGRLVMPAKIRRRLIEMATDERAAADISKERERVNRQLANAKRLFEMGDYTEEEYRSRRDELRAKLAGLPDAPKATDLSRAMDIVNDCAAMWAGATREERRDILRALFASIRIDLDAGRIVEFVPKVEFAALFRAAGGTGA